MAVFKPMILQKTETDPAKIMRKLYQFSQDLKYTLSNLSLDDNISKSVLDSITNRDERLRKMQFDSDKLDIDFENYKTGTQTELSQRADCIALLVSTGQVVKEMITRMEVNQESIRLTGGHIVINAQNMKLDRSGNATFSGAITGGSININTRFTVSAVGDVYIADKLTTTTLNPPGGIQAAEMEVYNDDDYINTITGAATCSELYVSEKLTCRRVRYTSDRRKKENIKELTNADLSALQPVEYRFKKTKTRSIGLIAQEVYKAQDSIKTSFGINRTGKYLELPYVAYTAFYVAAIKQNQARINKLQEEIKEVRRCRASMSPR